MDINVVNGVFFIVIGGEHVTLGVVEYEGLEGHMGGTKEANIYIEGTTGECVFAVCGV